MIEKWFVGVARGHANIRSGCKPAYNSEQVRFWGSTPYCSDLGKSALSYLIKTQKCEG